MLIRALVILLALLVLSILSRRFLDRDEGSGEAISHASDPLGTTDPNVLSAGAQESHSQDTIV
jgi:hypothetical protein